jgi:lipocalin
MVMKIVMLSLLACQVLGNFYWGWCPKATPVETLDVPEYIGGWYELARVKDVPYQATNRCGSARYTINEDGYLDVLNQCEGLDGAYI